MTPQQLIDRFRLDVRDAATDDDQLWSDVEVFSYMDDAQNLLARLTGGIADSTSGVARVSVRASTPFSAIDRRILKIRYAKLASNSQELELLNFEDIQAGAFQRTDYGYWTAPKIDDVEGPLRGMILGMEAHKVRFYPVPAEADTVYMTVYRLPLNPIEGANSELEVDEIHHTSLLLWMKHLAYSKQDAETYDRGKAAAFGEAFMNYCQQARQEKERREHKYRTVVYGGI